ncbi:AAA family ATPase [Mycobacteroides abscessus]|uniref:AAA family ATPase n=1 Tax=Mycobacteroides abscessus TaxID=36809 RepID=UPI0009A5F8E9|nr:AAA family ATPase [Mycobacteroides abscessus]RIT49722.1 hypothetical protein D2E80_10430 [Mycobacteroides abscessus]SKT07331.1 Uncharacterized conserved protein [Mycobacteroides abscessus subsp. massiliense]SKT54144.1 Uncharacterized conserved protein [Mycobacteroides abscessus subsp. massiliense]
MRWGIQDFKGLQEGKLALEDGTLTVLTGANSSGKSSILQSILMVTQSFYHSGGLVLNGPLVRLGDARDLVRTGAPTEKIGLSFEIPDQNDELDEQSSHNIKVFASMRPSEDSSTLHISRLMLSPTDDENSESAVFDKIRSRGTDIQAAVQATDANDGTEFLHVKNTFGSDRKILRTYIRMEGLDPVEIVQVADKNEIFTRYRHEIEAILNSPNPEKSQILTSSTRFQTAENRLYIGIIEFSTLLAGALKNSVEAGIDSDLGILLSVPRGNMLKLLEIWATLDKNTRNRALDITATARSSRPYVKHTLGRRAVFRTQPQWRQIGGVLELQLQQRLQATLTALSSLSFGLRSFSTKVQYLGPLRDEPRVVWDQWNELTRGLPVGTRGEYSAVRLSQRARRPTTYRRPNGDTRTGTLREAVDDWLAYLQIGDGVTAKSVGKLGVRVELQLSGHPRDLTAVGVGVSQALPLVVAVLAVPEHSIFIVEQPELHLHPAVQARLADFFLQARPDITSIVETHSDAFVTRIRRRAAESSISPGRVDIVFVEPKDHGSTMRSLSITEFGDLTEWPAGFISGEDEDAKAILLANLKRIESSNAGD